MRYYTLTFRHGERGGKGIIHPYVDVPVAASSYVESNFARI